MNGDSIERLPQEGECHNEAESGILESASTFSHRVLEEIEALAGTTACKSVQLVRLKKWAQEQGCWYGQHDIFDAVDGNVLIDDEENMFFIDTIIYPSDTGGYDTYRSLSPRCSNPEKGIEP